LTDHRPHLRWQQTLPPHDGIELPRFRQRPPDASMGLEDFNLGENNGSTGIIRFSARLQRIVSRRIQSSSSNQL
jgi:hypothetical protein